MLVITSYCLPTKKLCTSQKQHQVMVDMVFNRMERILYQSVDDIINFTKVIVFNIMLHYEEKDTMKNIKTNVVIDEIKKTMVEV